MIDDSQRVRRAARSVGLYVGLASALVIAGGVGILILVVLASSRRERGERGEGWFGPTEDDVVVDVDRLLPAVIVLGIVGVALLGVIAWFAARRSVRPLGDALRQQRNFVADASHELRTPLTTLTSRIQLLQRRFERGEPVEDTLVRLRRDADMMNDVLTDLLLSAEGQISPSTPSSDVVDAVTQAADSLHALADEAGVALRMVDHGTARVRLPAVTLTRIVVALIDNAIQHSPAGAAVTITTDHDQATAMIRVTDEGPGITGIATDQVFERFARSSESGRRRGFGLGLSLVRDVALRAGGTVAVERTSPRGTTFLLRLPMVD